LASVFGYGLFAQSGGDATGDRAKNVIFVLGDGLGPAQRDAIQLSKVGPYSRLTMDRLPYQGMSSTNAEDPETFVTDSLADETWWATTRTPMSTTLWPMPLASPGPRRQTDHRLTVVDPEPPG